MSAGVVFGLPGGIAYPARWPLPIPFGWTISGRISFVVWFFPMNTPRRYISIWTCVFAMLGIFAASAKAILVETSADFADRKIVSFSGFPFTINEGNPLEVGGEIEESILWTATPDGIIGLIECAFSGRGYWRPFERQGSMATSSQAQQNSMRFDFASAPVASVGFFMNYAIDFPGSPTGVWLDVYNAAGVLLESHNLFSAAPIIVLEYLDAGGFRGISRETNDIASFVIRSDGAFFALDDMAIGRVTTGVIAPSNAVITITVE